MIPKIIHYCWFGRNPIPELGRKCIESWKKHLCDYQLTEWNEDCFDIGCNKYVKKAYEEGEYAFVSDYARLYALFNFGGIYLDTDIEVLKSFDNLLYKKAFIGYESDNTLGTAVIASIGNHPWIGRQLDYYNNKSFTGIFGIKNKKHNTTITTNITRQMYGLDKKKIENGKKSCEFKDLCIFDDDYFYPRKWFSDDTNITDNTYTIHYYNFSWANKMDIYLKERYKNLKKYLSF